MARHLGAPVEHDDLAGPQQYPHPTAHESCWDRVTAAADRDPRMTIDPRMQDQAGLEDIERQRSQNGALGGEFGTNVELAPRKMPGIVDPIGGRDQVVEL